MYKQANSFVFTFSQCTSFFVAVAVLCVYIQYAHPESMCGSTSWQMLVACVCERVSSPPGICDLHSITLTLHCYSSPAPAGSERCQSLREKIMVGEV